MHHLSAYVAQDLRDRLQQAQEQLLCEQQAYAKIVLEEEALEADSGWLRQHIQGLLAEKRALQEEVERLKTCDADACQKSLRAQPSITGQTYFSCRSVTCYSSNWKVRV